MYFPPFLQIQWIFLSKHEENAKLNGFSVKIMGKILKNASKNYHGGYIGFNLSVRLSVMFNNRDISDFVTG